MKILGVKGVMVLPDHLKGALLIPSHWLNTLWRLSIHSATKMSLLVQDFDISTSKSVERFSMHVYDLSCYMVKSAGH